MTKGLLLILILATVMRLSLLGLIEYKADEALTVLSLKEFVKQPRLIQVGLVSSTGARNFPLFQYLLIPVAAMSTDPEFLSGVIGLLNVVMIGWFYMATRREFGDETALVAGILLAVAPYPVLFSRKIWAQDMVMLLAVPIYDLLLIIRRQPGKAKNQFWLALFLVLLAQLHGSGIFWMLAAMGYIGVKKIKLSKYALLGVAIGIIPTLPYFWLQLTSTPRLPDWKAYQQVSQMTQARPDIRHILMPFEYLSVFGWQEIMGSQDFSRFLSSSPAIGMGALASIVLAMGLLAGMYRMVKISKYRVLPVMMLGLMGSYGAGLVPGRLHYYVVAAPMIAAVTAIGFKYLFKAQPLFLKPSIGFVVVAYVLFGGMMAKYLIDNQGVNGDYGIPYQYSSVRVNEAVKVYESRRDIDNIKTYAHFEPTLAKQTEGKSIHAYLASYFLMINEAELASGEARLAGIQ